LISSVQWQYTKSALTSILDFFLSSEVVIMWQIDSVAYKLKPRSFYKSAYLWVHSVDFHSSVNCTWQYYQTPKSTITSEQFHLLNPLSQFHLQFNSIIHTSSPKWLSLTVTLQLWSHHLRHLSIWSCVLVTKWLIHQMLHNTQEKLTKETIHLQGLPLVQFNLAKQFHLFMV